MSTLAVIDIETTGLNPFRHDRIIELAAVITHLDGTVLREFVTLINPERDVGPTRIHNLSAQDVILAPRFSQIAGGLLDALNGCVALAGHNIRFDHSFLAVEFERLGYSFPTGPTLCTLQLSGGASLSRACIDHGIESEGQNHSALDDARATAQLLAKLLPRAPQLQAKISNAPLIEWPTVPKCSVRLLTRTESRSRQSEPPTFLQRLLARIDTRLTAGDESPAILSYTGLLHRALEDRYIDEAEGDALVELAERWSLSGPQIRNANWNYLLHLAAAALADGVVTASERSDLQRVAVFLGIDCRRLDEILTVARQGTPELDARPSRVPTASVDDSLNGKRVCFTGECQCRLNGEVISRSIATELASRRGLIVGESVTKKLDILVLADPMSQSGKAKKAREYGIRIVHEAVFWKMLGVEVE